MWEYKEIEGWYESETDGAGGYWHGIDMDTLNEAGKDGWELVHMERKGDEIVYAFLKRRFEDTNPGV